MSVIHFLPIEPMHERYTEQMLRWVQRHLGEGDFTYLPDLRSVTITTGQWLDVFGTIRFKAEQLASLATAFQCGCVRDGDWILLGDTWFPGIEAVCYMADLAHIKVGIAGWHYAGCFDPNDLLARDLRWWGWRWEQVLLQDILDLIAVGSTWFKNHLTHEVASLAPMVVTGYPWDPSEVEAYAVPCEERENIVVFPHRNAPEKQPEAFYRLARALHGTGWRFVVSTSSARDWPVPDGVEVIHHRSKDEYYRFLARCRIFFSAAKQETFGYALQEAIALGLQPVVPNRLCYPEMVQHEAAFLYDGDPRSLIEARMEVPVIPDINLTRQWADCTRLFIKKIRRTDVYYQQAV